MSFPKKLKEYKKKVVELLIADSHKINIKKTVRVQSPPRFTEDFSPENVGCIMDFLDEKGAIMVQLYARNVSGSGEAEVEFWARANSAPERTKNFCLPKIHSLSAEGAAEKIKEHIREYKMEQKKIKARL